MKTSTTFNLTSKVFKSMAFMAMMMMSSATFANTSAHSNHRSATKETLCSSKNHRNNRYCSHNHQEVIFMDAHHNRGQLMNCYCAEQSRKHIHNANCKCNCHKQVKIVTCMDCGTQLSNTAVAGNAKHNNCRMQQNPRRSATTETLGSSKNNHAVSNNGAVYQGRR